MSNTSKALPKQPEVNIGTIGHVDHGKAGGNWDSQDTRNNAGRNQEDLCLQRTPHCDIGSSERLDYRTGAVGSSESIQADFVAAGHLFHKLFAD